MSAGDLHVEARESTASRGVGGTKGRPVPKTEPPMERCVAMPY